jgi:hypothetical protein
MAMVSGVDVRGIEKGPGGLVYATLDGLYSLSTYDSTTQKVANVASPTDFTAPSDYVFYTDANGVWRGNWYSPNQEKFLATSAAPNGQVVASGAQVIWISGGTTVRTTN